MNRTVWLLGAMLLLSALSLYLLNRGPVPSHVSTGFGIPEYMHYTKVEQLEQEADLIIRARFTGTRNRIDLSITWPAAIDSAPYFVSQSTVKVTKVFKGNVQKGDLLLVNEEGYIEKDTYHGSIGYKWMTKKGDYLLFLERSPNSHVSYIVGNYQGKFDYTTPVDRPEDPSSQLEAFRNHRYEYYGEHPNEFYALKKQAIAHYPN
ncbi:hypothetical protein CIG75_17625 [Tumebacillus algifaecis]|uniref:Uncharacterized protein n=1 Tax=Tumebacillus algifaecis TaxID=1214604 RepID=A0A223D4Z4_9BACL|nr:hypothetical protein [Tumebacillus algifaecis]ASS76605.1 hypothetical protein CIG75_17625 [Tumebacillus algifaecis]